MKTTPTQSELTAASPLSLRCRLNPVGFLFFFPVTFGLVPLVSCRFQKDAEDFVTCVLRPLVSSGSGVPASVSHRPRSDDALLRLQESLQARRADLKGQRPADETRLSGRGSAAQRPRVEVGAGGHGVVLGHFLESAASWQRGGGGGALAECRFWSFQGADGRRVEPFEVGGGVRGCERKLHV